MEQERVTRAAEAIRAAESVVVLTGAGVSTASGIPDFRSDDGIWSEYDPSDFHISRFRTDPAGFWRERVDLVDDLLGDSIEPNAAHHALADLEAGGYLDTLITQNIDGLHEQAGSEDPIEIHGNADRTVCTECGRRSPYESVEQRVKNGDVPPTCRECGGVLKPDVVLFGESLPEMDLQKAREAARKASLFIVVGSSLTVEPAGSLPRIALDTGGTLCIVNLDQTPLSNRAEFDFRDDVTAVLPAIRDALIDEKPE